MKIPTAEDIEEFRADMIEGKIEVTKELDKLIEQAKNMEMSQEIKEEAIAIMDEMADHANKEYQRFRAWLLNDLE